jgi:hypothetical protein
VNDLSRRAALALGPALAALAAHGPSRAAALATRVLLLECDVAGMPYYDADAALAALRPGAPLLLRREPGNRHDALAIEVSTAVGLKLGYVPRLHNPVIARLMDAGKRIVAEVVEVGLPLSDYLVEEQGDLVHVLNAGPRRRRVNYRGALIAIYLAE